MLLEILSEVISSVEDVKDGIVAPTHPEYRIKWDWDEGRIKLEEKNPYEGGKMY